MAASATFALKVAVWFRRGRLFMVSPDSLGTACPLSGRNSTYRSVQISETSSVVHVPFQGGGPAVQSTIAGHTQIIHIISPAVAPHLKEGTLRALAVASKVRSPAFPDVPTLEEAGVPNHEVAFWMGGVVPFGTPRYIVELLQAQFAKVMALPEIKQRFRSAGLRAFREHA